MIDHAIFVTGHAHFVTAFTIARQTATDNSTCTSATIVAKNDAKWSLRQRRA